MVSGLSIPIPSPESAQTEMKIIELELLGEAVNGENGEQRAFERGVSVFPSLGDAIYTTNADDFDLLTFHKPDSFWSADVTQCRCPAD